MDALDFHVDVSGGDGRYEVSARAPSGGEVVARAHLVLDELRALSGQVRHAVLASSVRARRAVSDEELPVQRIGAALYGALVTDRVRALLDASRHQATREGRRLRLVLQVRPPELAGLPWEFLYDTDEDDYVCLGVPLIRRPAVLQPQRPLRVGPPLRVLGMVARPDDLPRLSTDEERHLLTDALWDLERDGSVELHWVAGQGWRDLQEAMRDGPWHILHFIGHGGFDTAADEGALALADEDGRTRLLHAGDLAMLLRNHPSLRLVMLNACDTGRANPLDPFSGLAGALMRRGLPAVLAMQFEISDHAAIEFARTFYRSLAHRLPVDDATTDARQAIRLATPGTLEWGTPVLYLRSPDGHLFGLPDPSAQPTSTQPAQSGRVPPHAARRPTLDPALVTTVTKPQRLATVASSPDGRLVAVAGGGRHPLVIEVPSGRTLHTLRHGITFGVHCAAFSPDGSVLATGGNRTVYTWNVHDGTKGVRHKIGRGEVYGVAFSPDGHRLAAACSYAKTRIWDDRAKNEPVLIDAGHPLAAMHGVAFSPDGTRLALAGPRNTAGIWNSSTGTPLLKVRHWERPHTTVRDVAFCPDGQWLATAAEDMTARIWDATTGAELLKVCHDSTVTSVVFGPEGRWFATASYDRTARIWDAVTGAELFRTEHRYGVCEVATSADGQLLATASMDKTCQIWRL